MFENNKSNMWHNSKALCYYITQSLMTMSYFVLLLLAYTEFICFIFSSLNL
jgi:hypothetical protein